MVGLQVTVPANVGCRIGVAATKGNVPATGDPIGAVVAPIDIPPIDRTGTRVGYFHCGGKAIIPLVVDHIFASCLRLGGQGCHNERKTCYPKGL